MRRPDQVIVVSGGLSFEREISLRSGHLVADALQDAGLNAVAVDFDSGLLESLSSFGSSTVAFNVLHGPAGEDGSLQDVLDASEVRYVGSVGDASRLAYDKPTAKYLARSIGISTPAFSAVTEQTFRDLGTSVVLDRLGDKMGYPLIVKPTRGGSAFGLSLAKSRAELPLAMVRCFEHSTTALLESYVGGTEIAVGIIEGQTGLTVLPPVEIVSVSGIYDFEARYNPGRAEYYIPPRLPTSTVDILSAAAKTIHVALGLRHISRCDFIVDKSGIAQFLEITASPGLAETSVMLMAMRDARLAPAKVFGELAELAFNSPLVHYPDTTRD